jgi:hypothetical protein
VSLDTTIEGIVARRVVMRRETWEALEALAAERGQPLDEIAEEILRAGLGPTDALRVACPVCGAKAGAACDRRTTKNRLATRPHERRLLAARQREGRR